jgi:hypothetical protein
MKVCKNKRNKREKADEKERKKKNNDREIDSKTVMCSCGSEKEKKEGKKKRSLVKDCDRFFFGPSEDVHLCNRFGSYTNREMINQPSKDEIIAKS